MRQPDNTFHCHRIVNAIIRDFSSNGISSDLPHCAIPVSTTTHGNIIHVHAFHHALKLCLPSTITSTTMLSYIRTCTVQERRILGYCKDLTKLQELLPHLTSSNTVFASDGSHHRRLQRATGSWVISSKNGKLRCYGVSPVDGDLSSLNDFRTELEAIRSLLYWLRLLIKVYSITRPSDWHVFIWIDNSSALKYSKLDDFFKPNQHIGNGSDIINDIFAVKTELQISH
jgi:hypothetical protein